MHLNIFILLLLCFTVLAPHLLYELYCVTDDLHYGSTAQVLVITITHSHVVSTHFLLFWGFIRHLSIIHQSKIKRVRTL